MSYRPFTYDSGPNITEILSSGAEAAYGRHLMVNTGGLSNGNFRATCFTARKSQTITSIRTFVSSTAQAGATLCRIGLYTVDSSDNITLVASTTNDTSLWSTPSVSASKALSSTYPVVRGQRYAIGMIVVGSSTAPVMGLIQLASSTEAAQLPRVNVLLGSQSDLPSSIAVGSMSATTTTIYAVLEP